MSNATEHQRLVSNVPAGRFSAMDMDQCHCGWTEVQMKGRRSSASSWL
ncbi:hypothetical protein FOWG_16256 [Fusarium oxysporum f. sp. lycopersici MN25]|nr:hypothetical protein FOWG_16256 [Fusarium oxysporum f. sp. lycopersici MN25]